jgi:hypothetical protein
MAQNESSKEYDLIIVDVFNHLIHTFGTEVDKLPFTKDDIITSINALGLEIRNVLDVTYTYRVGRSDLPDEILEYGNWAIEGAGKGRYFFVRAIEAFTVCGCACGF